MQQNQNQNQSNLYSKLLFAASCVILAFALMFMKRCGDEKLPADFPKPSRTIVTVTDTVWPDTVFYPVPVLVKAPVDSYPVPVADTNICKFVRVYSDSLVDSNLVIVYRDSVQGKLLDKKLSYRLKVPLKIETTTTITDSIPYPVPVIKSGVYAVAEVGADKLLGNKNLSVGVDLITKKKYGFGVRYNILQSSYNFNVKYRLF